MNAPLTLALLCMLALGVYCSNETLPLDTVTTTISFDGSRADMEADGKDWDVEVFSVVIPSISDCIILVDPVTEVSSSVVEKTLTGCLDPVVYTLMRTVQDTTGEVDGVTVPANSLLMTHTLSEITTNMEGNDVIVKVHVKTPSSKLASGSLNSGILADGRYYVSISDEGQTLTLAMIPTSTAFASTSIDVETPADFDDVDYVVVNYVFTVSSPVSLDLAARRVAISMSTSAGISPGPEDPTADDDDDDDRDRQAIVSGSVLGALGIVILVLAGLLCLLGFLVFVILVVVIIVVVVVLIVFVAITSAGSFFGVGPAKDVMGRGKLYPGQQEDVFLDEEDFEDQDLTDESDDEL